jgi:electron transfer flavoprotein alpha subunit
MKNIGILIETENGGLKSANLGMITLARAADTQLTAFVADVPVAAVRADLEAHGISRIVALDLDDDQQQNPVVLAKVLVQAVGEFKLDALIGLSTAHGKDLLPRIAAFLDAPLVMDCIAVDFDQNLVRTSQYSGKTLATIEVSGAVFIFGIRPNVIDPVRAPVAAEVVSFEGRGLETGGFKVLQTDRVDETARLNLAEADVILSGGRGMGNGENFSLLYECAAKLNAAVGASRVAVDSGWVPYPLQVGQTGEKVSPRVYIACGISGSVQHFAGMKTAGMVIAINTDAQAAIMSNCDYFAVADVLEVIPALTKQLANE